MIYFNCYLISVIVRGVLRVLFVSEVLENVMILAVLVFASHFLILFRVVSYCLALSLHGVLFCRFFITSWHAAPKCAILSVLPVLGKLLTRRAESVDFQLVEE